MKRIFIPITVAVVLVVIYYAFSKRRADPQPEIREYADRIHTPEEELAGFSLQDGFVIELVASEREGIINPIDLTFDDAGRLWTQTARMYPLDPFADTKWDELLKLMDDQETQQNHPAFKRVLDLFQGRTKGTDQILIVSDFYGRNKTADVTVWADSLTIPMSILPFKEGAFVAQGSELFLLQDTDGNDKADTRKPLITGFGFTDTHTMAHSLVRGPGGWMYFSHGALNKGRITSLTSGESLDMNYSKIARFSADATKIELVAAGLNNIWGFQLRHNGQWYATEANDLGYTTVPLEAGAGFPGIGNVRFREYQPFMPELHKFRVGGTGLSGLAFADDRVGSFPDEWRDVALLANPITSTINAVRVVRNADGTVTNEHLPDFLTSSDKYFRPVNMEFGPDGCLYVADWYNKIVSHNEVPTSHPERDRKHGRIWRIRHVNQEPRNIVNFYEVATPDLVDYLKSPYLFERRSAWHQISDRPTQETSELVPGLVTLAGDSSQDESTRIHALWSLEALGHYDPDLISAMLASNNDDVRRESVRSLISFGVSPAQAAAALSNLIDDANPMVRSQVIRTLGDLKGVDASTIALLVHACKPELPGNEMGGSYERRFERYLALMALEQYPRELLSFIREPAGRQPDPVNLLWAIRALPQQQMEELFPRLWSASGLEKLDESNFLTVSKMLDNPKVHAFIRPVLHNPAHAEQYLRFAIQNQELIHSAKFAEVLKVPAERFLTGGKEDQIDLALDAIGRFKINTPSEKVVRLIHGDATDQTISLIIKVLERDPQKNGAIFAEIARNEKISVNRRISAAHNLARTDSKSATQILRDLVPTFNADQKMSLTTAFSSSGHGSRILVALFNEKILAAEAFSLAAAEGVAQHTNDNGSATPILERVKKRIEDEKQLFEERLTKYVAIAKRRDGNPENGEVLFQTCLTCHRVGDKGQSIAPALDGSASREDEALFTALLDPDAAVERGYTLFRVIRKDNTTVEGYLSSRDGNGTTISFMGGSKVFIPVGDIKNQYALGGRSFMPRGLIDGYTDEQVADLAAYIRTLK